jgi:hypothetical protein
MVIVFINLKIHHKNGFLEKSDVATGLILTYGRKIHHNKTGST